MHTILGLTVTKQQGILINQVLEHARSLAGNHCVYKVTGQASKPELRAALRPGDENSDAEGVFLMLALTGKNISVRRAPRFFTGHHLQRLTQDTLPSVLTDVNSWFEEAKKGPGAPPVSRNPAWTRDELILALELYFRMPPWTVNASHPDIQELSETLNRLSATDRPDADRYRNVNGTYMKLMNLQYRDPTRNGRGLKGGGALEAEIWAEFGNDKERLSQIAAKIRAAVAEGSSTAKELNQVGPIPEDEEAMEGGILTRLHRVRERNQKIVRTKKNQVLKETGALKCEVCTFDFLERYGELGREYIECHHTKPLSQLEVGTPTKLVDLALVCANCHRMLHRPKHWLTMDDLVNRMNR